MWRVSSANRSVCSPANTQGLAAGAERYSPRVPVPSRPWQYLSPAPGVLQLGTHHDVIGCGCSSRNTGSVKVVWGSRPSFDAERPQAGSPHRRGRGRRPWPKSVPWLALAGAGIVGKCDSAQRRSGTLSVRPRLSRSVSVEVTGRSLTKRLFLR
jgi:hypothetical protein